MVARPELKVDVWYREAQQIWEAKPQFSSISMAYANIYLGNIVFQNPAFRITSIFNKPKQFLWLKLS